jgi:hypothetical protein
MCESSRYLGISCAGIFRLRGCSVLLDFFIVGFSANRRRFLLSPELIGFSGEEVSAILFSAEL